MVESRRRVGITMQPPRKWNVFDPGLIRWRLQAGDRRRTAGLAVGAAARIRTGRRGPGRAAGESRTSAGSWPRPSPTWWCTAGPAISMHTCWRTRSSTETLLDASGNEMFRALNDVVAEVLAGRTQHGLMPDSRQPGGHRVARRGRPCHPAGATRKAQNGRCERSSTRPPPRWPAVIAPMLGQVNGSFSALARRFFDRLEPVHEVTYFAAEAATRHSIPRAIAASGWDTSPLARPRWASCRPEVVAAAFYNFTTERVARALPAAWDKASPATLLRAAVGLCCGGTASIRRRGLRVDSPRR